MHFGANKASNTIIGRNHKTKIDHPTGLFAKRPTAGLIPSVFNPA